MTPLRIALIYLVVSSVWILSTDRFVYWWVDDASSFLFWQTAKGWLFVGVSSFLIYLLALRLSSALTRQLELKRRHLELLRRKAHTDYLTGLPNRRYGMRTMQRLAVKAKRDHSGFCVMLLDIDDFKQINDSLEHKGGDRIIVALSRRLQEHLGPDERLARQGGDEFLITCTGVQGRQNIANRASQILDVINQPFVSGDMELTVTGSMGVACFPGDGEDLSTLMRSVELALHSSKKYKNCFNLYDPVMADNLQRRFDLQHKLREAIATNTLAVFFQPVYDPTENRIAGSEALVRWPTESGFVPPAEFIPVAEQSGQIRALGSMVLEEAFRQTQLLIQAESRPMTISVNVSPKQFVNGYIVKDVKRAMAATGIDPCCVILEITEGVLLNNVEEVSEVLAQLIKLGVAISLDDFGQGYSSLSYLRQHPFRYVKIDRSFVQGMDESAQDRALVEAGVAMARALDLKVVAEGVETLSQENRLKALGVDYLQGYLRGRPMPFSEYQSAVQCEGSLR